MSYYRLMNVESPLPNSSVLPPIGAHFSTAGGLPRALEEAYGFRCGVAQLFTASPRQWTSPPVSDSVRSAFLETHARTGVLPIAHAAYLINLAATGDNGVKSLQAFTSELRRCEALGIPYLVVHPGSAGDIPLPQAIRQVARRLDEAVERSETRHPLVLLETTAGMGHTIGATFEHLAEILSVSRFPNRLGICFDTAHAFESGFDIRTVEGYEQTFDALFSLIPPEKLLAFHLNDSQTDLGSHVDRHAHLGQGKIGLDPFRRLVRDPRFAPLPKCLETEDDDQRPEDIRWLHRFLQDSPAPIEERRHERAESPRSGSCSSRPRSH